jgi:hypothetical protein
MKTPADAVQIAVGFSTAPEGLPAFYYRSRVSNAASGVSDINEMKKG